MQHLGMVRGLSFKKKGVRWYPLCVRLKVVLREIVDL